MLSRIWGASHRGTAPALLCALLVSACQAATLAASAPAAGKSATRTARPSDAAAKPGPRIAPLGAAAPSVALWPGGVTPAGAPGAETPPVVSGHAVNGDAMDVNADAGVTYRSPDGSLVAVIPPGALDRDATVRFVRENTADGGEQPGYLPGVRFVVDLGGARLMPGESLVVTTRLEDAAAARIQGSVPAALLESFGIARDTSGHLTMTRTVDGPAVSSVVPPTTAGAGSAWAAIEYGGLPIAPAPEASAPRQRRLLAADGQTHFAVNAPKSVSDVVSLENAGVFTCGLTAQCITSQVIAATTDSGQEANFAACGVVFDGGATPTAKPVAVEAVVPPTGGGVPASPSPRPAPAKPRPVAAPLAARVVWTSDDPALNGRPVPRAAVHFRIPGGKDFGPATVLSDQRGVATTYAPPGTPAYIQAESPAGDISSALVEATADPGASPAQIAISNNNPSMQLRIDSDRPLPARVTITYELKSCGCKHDLTVDVPNPGSTSAILNFKVPVSPDAPADEQVKLDGLRFDNQIPPAMLPPAVAIKRNATVALAVRIGPPEQPK